MKIIVDTAGCTGHARCSAEAPEVYELDNDGYCAVTELEVPTHLEDAATRGARACPERAVTVT